MAGNTKGQLEALSRAQALPAFGAQHFAMAAAWARAGQPGGGQPCIEVIKAALEGRLQCLTAQAPMECAAVAEVSRGTPGLATTNLRAALSHVVFVPDCS